MKSIIEELTLEFIERNGCVTCEFATSPDKIGEHMREIWKFQPLLEPLNAYWHVSVCTTCHKQQGGEDYIHVQIIKREFMYSGVRK
jgi:hypothetical protein